MIERVIRVTVNGRVHEKTVEVRKTLADFLRDDLDLTGTHLGCEHGVCGACTVIADGDPVRSCLLFAVQCEDLDLETVEGLAVGAPERRYHDLTGVVGDRARLARETIQAEAGLHIDARQ